jgi:NAD(P)-dependent dehydrogenase (short-subunit alcohol dehydrogenase family)
LSAKNIPTCTCALLLDRYGVWVFSGIRKERDGQSLQSIASERLTPLLIDVTELASIAQAAARVQECIGSAGLASLVNNAGIGVSGPVEYLPLDELRNHARRGKGHRRRASWACLRVNMRR